MNKEIPILFSTMMVQALLAGRKTQTRRGNGLKKVNENPDQVRYLRMQEFPDGTWRAVFQHENEDEPGSVKSPYGKPGDILWVREGFQHNNKGGFIYKSDVTTPVTWKPSIHMPKEAARIWLQVESITVERLQDISDEDAIAEGIEIIANAPFVHRFKAYDLEGSTPFHQAKESFQSLWMKINGKESWLTNPWVWIVTFKMLSTTGKPKNI